MSMEHTFYSSFFQNWLFKIFPILILTLVGEASIAQTANLTLNFGGQGQGAVLEAKGRLYCGASCSKSFPKGTQLTLKPSPSHGSQLVKWVGCDSVQSQICLVRLNDSRAVKVKFAPATLNPTLQGAQTQNVSFSPDNLVKVSNGQLVLHGQRFFAKGVNYGGSWRLPTTIQGSATHENFGYEIYWFKFDAAAIEADFLLLRQQLGATTVRIGIGSEESFAPNVLYHGAPPFYLPDGTISPTYLKRLLQMADIAERVGLRLIVTLFWDIGSRIYEAPERFRPGTERDLFYRNYVRSVASALRDHTGILAFDIANESMLNWGVNGENRSWLETHVLSFLTRRIREVRLGAPHHLITTGEIAFDENQRNKWFWPSPEFALIDDIDNLNNRHPFSLASLADFVSPHFYFVTLRPEDNLSSIDSRSAFASSGIRELIRMAKEKAKPLVAGEFGMQIETPVVTSSQTFWEPLVSRYFSHVLKAVEKGGMDGMLVWGAMPVFRLIPGQFQILRSHLNPFSPTELVLQQGGTERRILTFTYDLSYHLFSFDSAGSPQLNSPGKALRAIWSETIPFSSSVPRTDLVHVSYGELQLFDPACSFATSTLPSCARAAKAACVNRGYRTGFGPVESDHASAYLSCFTPAASVVFELTNPEIQSLHPGCVPGEESTLQCNSMARRACVNQGYGGGFLSASNFGSATVSCVTQEMMDLKLTSYLVLNQFHEHCSFASINSGACYAAVRRYCANQPEVYGGGVGPVETNGVEAYVSCYRNGPR